MSKPLIVLADVDEEYLLPLELKLLKELENRVEMEVITETWYFEDFFSVPRTIDVMFVSEQLYNAEMHKHNIKNLFILYENAVEEPRELSNIRKIYKYTSVKEIYNEMLYVCGADFGVNAVSMKQTQILVVYSPIGGCGKTTIALGLAACLEQNHKKVLYVNAEYLQTFHCWMKMKEPLPINVERLFSRRESDLYRNVQHSIRKEYFAYLPPFRGALGVLNIDFSVYESFIQEVRESKEYDYIVVDTGTVYTAEKASLIDMADKVFLITQKNVKDYFKLNMLVNNMNISDTEKFILVCNNFEPETDGVQGISDLEGKYMISSFIKKQPVGTLEKIEDFMKIEDFHKLTYMII